jgi:hypothetical protein
VTFSQPFLVRRHGDSFETPFAGVFQAVASASVEPPLVSQEITTTNATNATIKNAMMFCKVVNPCRQSLPRSSREVATPLNWQWPIQRKRGTNPTNQCPRRRKSLLSTRSYFGVRLFLPSIVLHYGHERWLFAQHEIWPKAARPSVGSLSLVVTHISSRWLHARGFLTADLAIRIYTRLFCECHRI